MNDVGQQIKYFRKQKGLSQKKLGDKIGMSQQQITQYENGKRIPKYETLGKLAQALGVEIYKLYNTPGDIIRYEGALEDFSEKSITVYRGELEYNLLETFRKLNEDGQNEAYKRTEELTYITKYSNTAKEYQRYIDSMQDSSVQKD